MYNIIKYECMYNIIKYGYRIYICIELCECYIKEMNLRMNMYTNFEYEYVHLLCTLQYIIKCR